MTSLFLVAIVTPLALLVLNVAGVLTGRSTSTRRPPVRAAIRRPKRHRRDYFGDFEPGPAPAMDSLGADAELYLPVRATHAVQRSVAQR